MVKPPISNPSASLDEKKQSPSAHSVPISTTTVAADNDDPDIRTKRFSRDFASFNEKHSPERLFANRNSASPQFTNSFDIDLESGKHVDARPTHLKVPRTTTVHSNASSPAVIGSPHEHRGFGFDDDEEDEIDLGVPRAPGGGGPIERGRPRRRNRRNPAGPPMGLRRAQSLPSHPAMTAPPPIQGLQPSMVQTLNKLLEPERKLAPPPNLRVSLYNIATYSWLNVMLVFVPIAWGAHFAHLTDTVIFVFSFLGIVPLAALLGFATEELALRVGQTLGGLLNATFGNAVELIIAILALVKGELRVVQASMLGSILSNCLLVLGMCFFAGGFRFHEQGYGIRAAQLNISLLSISVFSIVIPAAFNSSLNFGDEQASSGHQDQNKTDRAVLAISRGTSIILLFVYAAYLVFQLWTHAYIYSKEASAYHSAMTHQAGGVDGPTAPPGTRVFRMPHLPSLPSLTIHGHSDTSSSRRSSRRSSSSSTSSSSSSSSSSNSREEEEHQKLKPIVAFALLIVVTVLTGLTAEYLVDSISGLTATGDISREFIALILLPLVGNAAEHVTAVTVSVKNKLDLAITVAVGSSIQIALFVIPFLVLLGWIIGQPLSLFFDIYETVVVFVSILVVNYAISDGKTNWLEGLVLMVIYVLIALTTWFYPGTNVE